MSLHEIYRSSMSILSMSIQNDPQSDVEVRGVARGLGAWVPKVRSPARLSLPQIKCFKFQVYFIAKRFVAKWPNYA